MPKTITIDQDRLARVTELRRGSHKKPNGEFAACVMEAVSYVSGLPWSDHPSCACPVITAFMVSWNDGLPDEDRTRLLLPLIPEIVGTKVSKKLESRRATMAADWLVRVHTPAWLRLAGLAQEADALSGLPEITDFAKTPSIMGPLKAAKSAANQKWAAARAARDAAWDAAEDATRAAARAAAQGAAQGAARAAARAALKPTTESLQTSALDLVRRMCALKDEA